MTVGGGLCRRFFWCRLVDVSVGVFGSAQCRGLKSIDVSARVRACECSGGLRSCCCLGLIRVRVGGMFERRLFGGGGYWVFWV